MSITTLSAPATVGRTSKQRVRVGLAFAISLAVLLVALVSSFFPPLTDADRAEMLIDGTSGLPQDR